MRATTVLFVLCIAQCLAWGEEGHKIVAQIASDRLSDDSNQYLAALLDGTKYDTLPEIAPLADDYDHSSGGRWSSSCHYVNLPRDATNYDSSYCGKCCVVGAIANYTKLLAQEVSSPQVCEFGKKDEPCPLEFLVHYVGDCHQPLHISYADDRGGNSVKVKFINKKTNLHSVWDTYIIQRWLKDYSDATEYLNKEIANNPDKIAKFESQLKPATWADESFQITQNNVYDFDGDELDESYYKENLSIIQWRLIAAGVRLAATINKITANN